jgi:hypothetical protein
MPALFSPACAITTTRRRRLLWAAWWTGAPCRDPFRKPDAFEGGARTHDEALAAAERVAGTHLVEIDARWARAWARILVGRAPWGAAREAGEQATSAGRAGASREDAATPRTSIWAILGVPSTATDAELKRAFRARALERHPDRGGTADAFRDLTRAYEEARKRAARPRKKHAH